MMKLLIQMAKDGKEMTIQLSAWEKIPKSGGTPYISISSEVYYKPEGQQQQYQQPQQQQPQYQPAPPPPPPVQQPAPQAAPTPSSDFIDDDIPF
jgi:single-stranded DNA-binding protein